MGAVCEGTVGKRGLSLLIYARRTQCDIAVLQSLSRQTLYTSNVSAWTLPQTAVATCVITGSGGDAVPERRGIPANE